MADVCPEPFYLFHSAPAYQTNGTRAEKVYGVATLPLGENGERREDLERGSSWYLTFGNRININLFLPFEIENATQFSATVDHRHL